jgi:4-hydroxybenzoate polyprenyltransferase
MDLKIFKQFIKISELILVLSLGYIGLFFTGRVDFTVWILFTVALMCARIAFLSFQFILKDKNKTFSLKELFKDAKKNSTILLYGIISSAFFIFLFFIINELCYYVSILSVILLIAFPLLKRYSYIPDYNLWLFEAMCPVVGYIAVNNRFELIPFILFASVIFWTAGLEISIGIYDIRKDKNIKNYIIKKFGAGRSRLISVLFFIISILMLIVAGFIAGRGLAYWISLFCLAIILLRQEILLNSKDVETTRTEFLQINNFTAPLLLIGTLIDIFYK